MLRRIALWAVLGTLYRFLNGYYEVAQEIGSKFASRRPLVLFVCFVFFLFVCFHSLYNIIRTLWPICFSKVDSAHVIFYYS